MVMLRTIGVTAPFTGSGKTTVALSLLASLKKSVGIKIGPDYIDAQLMAIQSGERAYNMDRWIMGRSYRDVISMAAADHDFAVVEGVMGLYDGREPVNLSTDYYFRKLGIKYLVVLDSYRSGESLYYISKGFLGSRSIGVVINNYTTEGHLKKVSKEFEKHGVRIVGAIPFDEAYRIPERHLGLSLNTDKKVTDKITERVSGFFDIDFIKRSASVTENVGPVKRKLKTGRKNYRIAVALDRAFSFYYRTSIEALESIAELEFFSPLNNEIPSQDPDMIYIGGGYPELYGRDLERGDRTKEYLREFHRKAGFIYAECGGMMYLLDELVNGDERFGMSSVLKGVSVMKKFPVLRYATGVSEKGNPLFCPGEKVMGHEYHYSIAESGEKNAFTINTITGERYKGGLMSKNTLASYLHIDFYRYLEIAEHLLKKSSERYPG